MPTCIIGDVHGRMDHLEELLDAVRKRFGDDVEYVSVGDLIDRGPDSKKVVEAMIQVGATGLLGNHETWMVDYLLKGEFWPGLLNPMMGTAPTVDSYNDGSIGERPVLMNAAAISRHLSRLIPDHHREFFLNLRCSLRLDVAGVTYWVSHAGLKVSAVERMCQAAREHGKTIPDEILMGVAERVELDSLIWEHADIFPIYRYGDGSVQVFGHIPVPKVESTPHHIALDTGCGRTRQKPDVLSAVVLPEEGGRHIITGGRWLLGRK